MDDSNIALRKRFFKYFAASFFSTLVVSVYSTVDCIMVGHYEGPCGTAAIATIMPVWNLIMSVGLLFGIGGAVLMSTCRGKGEREKGDEYFTAALILNGMVTAIIWAAFLLFDDAIMRFFGAEGAVLALALKYISSIKIVMPLFMFENLLVAFLRNDNAPMLPSLGLLAGGIFNIIGDYYLVFVRDMGIYGAGLATSIGQIIAITVMVTHFFSHKNTLRLRAPKSIVNFAGKITENGFSTFIVDIASGFLNLLFNRSIMYYYDADVLSIFGVICNVVMTVQCLSYAVGQAAQPLISINYGAGDMEKVKRLKRLGIITATALTFCSFIITMLFPRELIKLFMDSTENILLIAPRFQRTYYISFILMGFNVFSTYYLQAILKPKMSIIISLLRSVIISGALVIVLPALFGRELLWWVMPVTEAAVFIPAALFMKTERTQASGPCDM